MDSPASPSKSSKVNKDRIGQLGFRAELFIQAYFLLQTVTLILSGLSISDLSVDMFSPSLAFFQISLYCFILSILYLTETIILKSGLGNKNSKFRFKATEVSEAKLKAKEKQFSVLAFMSWAIVVALKTNLWHLIAGLCLIAISYAYYNKAWGRAYNISFIILFVLFIDRFGRKDNSLPESFSGIAEYKYDLEIIKRYIFIVLIVVIAVICIYLAYKYLASKKGRLSIYHDKSSKILWILGIALALLALVIIVWTQIYLWARLRTYSVSSYDMGVFTQMYHSINRNGMPLTTVERDFQTSHFNIHVSPTLYLLAPLFKLFPYPETLQLVQIFVVYIALIPFLLLAREYGLKSSKLLIAAVVFALQPGFLLSNYYDFHENIFLAPCIMFLIYFIYKGKYLGVAISGLLLLGVKEDAVIYFVAIAIYLFLGSKDEKVTKFNHKQARLLALIMVLVGVSVFVLNILYLRNFGTGDMSGRFSNLMPKEEYGLIGVLFSLIFNPSFYLLTIFIPRKFIFLLLTLMFMGFLPLFNRRLAGVALFIPLLIINLSSNYAYQFEFFYQYNYGSHLFLLVLALIVVTDNIFIKKDKQEQDQATSAKTSIENSNLQSLSELISETRVLQDLRKALISLGLVTAIVASACINIYALFNRKSTIKAAINPSQRIEEYDKVLAQIPRDEIIWADPFFTTRLGEVEFLYDLDHHKYEVGEELPKYIVMPENKLEQLEEEIQNLILDSYELSDISGEYISVYELKKING